jgi:GNAT superfamily N-acetyltransferase
MTGIQFHVGQPLEPAEVATLARSVYGDDPDLGCESYFRWLYHDNPSGEAVVAAARVDGILVGHYAVVPIAACLDGDDILAGQGVNAMTRRDLEGRGIFARLVSLADEACRDRGIRLVYAIPGPQAAPWYQTVLRYRGATPVPLWVRPVRMGGLVRAAQEGPPPLRWLIHGLDAGLVPLLRPWRSLPNPDRLEIRSLDRLGVEADGLWKRTKGQHPFLLTRASAHLSWRFLRCPTRRYRIRGAYFGGDLVAYLIFRERRLRRRPWMRMGSLVHFAVEPGARGKRALGLLVGDAILALAQEGVGAIMAQGAWTHVGAVLRRNGFWKTPQGARTWLPLMMRRLDSPEAGQEWPADFHFLAGDHDMG